MNLHRAYRTQRWWVWSGLAMATGPVTLAMTALAWPNLQWAVMYSVPILGSLLLAFRSPRVAGWLFIAGGVLIAVVLLPFLAMGLYAAQPDGVEAGEWLGLALGLAPSSMMVIGGVLLLVGFHRWDSQPDFDALPSHTPESA